MIDRLHRVQELFFRLAPLPRSVRRDALARLQRRDPAMAEELVSLLAGHDGEGPVDRLLAVLAPDAGRPEAGDSLTGQQVGDLTVLEPIGTGGMGLVYRGRDATRGRDVAVKLLAAPAQKGSRAEARLLAEARAVATVNHPAVCGLIETGELPDGRIFLVLPFYEGETLKVRLARGALPVPDAVRIAADVARGLAAAHRCGIIHRDIKPANLMLGADGQVRILDFGIAKLGDMQLTRTGERPGTLHYMSPEQLSGAPVGARSDLWALGVVLFEMLAGRRPFEGDNVAVAASVLAREPVPDLATLRPEVPPGLGAVVERLLQADPAARYENAEEVVGALEAVS
ncbi:MAG TPA: serine/threonine-protein kinase [Gemmatimonadales bacterium]|jgi:serine/threonine-protein kinase|nr:serine/threonine-protein kinase [Gemmatimonadales bacterium]